MRFIKSLLRKTDIQTSHHSNHTIPPIGNLINPLSNHHTKIIRKSIELRNVSKQNLVNKIGKLFDISNMVSSTLGFCSKSNIVSQYY